MKAIARKLRWNLTDAERALWQQLRYRQVSGLKFRRQHPIGLYVVDFVCLEQRLIIEVDGSQHAEHIPEDAQRTRWLESQGYRVLRFWNHEVLGNADGVIHAILSELQSHHHPSPPPSRGREISSGVRP